MIRRIHWQRQWNPRGMPHPIQKPIRSMPTIKSLKMLLSCDLESRYDCSLPTFSPFKNHSAIDLYNNLFIYIFYVASNTKSLLVYSHLWQKIYSQVPASVAQLDAPSDWRPGGCGLNPRQGQQHSFVEIDHEIFSTVILSLPLIQEGQLWRKNVHNTG